MPVEYDELCSLQPADVTTLICNVHHVFDALNMITIFIVWAAWQGTLG